MNKRLNPLIPMGAITGKPTAQEIRKMLEAYKSVGIEQFLIYPRSGCEIEYLSEEWFTLCKNILETAKSLDMKIYLYDDFNWPSAQCAGRLVLEHPEFAQKQLKLTESDGKIECTVINTAELLENPNVRANPLDGRFPKSDLLNPNAVKAFVEMTHAEYYRRFSEYFGSTVLGIFTDEPTYIYCCDANLPYYDDAKFDYKAQYSRDLFTDVENAVGIEKQNFLNRYFAMVGRRFRSVFFDYITEWCTKHGVKSTGHLLAEQDISQRANGNVLAALSGLSLPGMDEIFTSTEYETAELLTLAVAEYAARKNGGGLAELFALGPSDMELSEIRKMLGIAALHGINNYVLAVSAFDVRGNFYKDSYFNPHSYTQPWFPAYKILGEEARLMADYAEKSPIAQIEIVLPLTEGRRTVGNFVDSEKLFSRFIDLIRLSEQRQWSIRLLDEDDSPCSDAVISVTNDGYSFCGSCVSSLEDTVEKVEAILKRDTFICDKSGKLLTDIMLKTYNDGFAAVDMRESGEARSVCITHGEKSYEAVMYPRDFICDKTLSTNPTPSYLHLSDVKTDFSLLLSSPCLMRVFALCDGTSFTASEDISNLRMALRKYRSDDIELFLDGEKIVSDPYSEAPKLPTGISGLYSLSRTFSIEKGTHRITFSNNSLKSERRYLPLAILCGDFALDKAMTVSHLPERVGMGDLTNILSNYVGKITLETEMSFPFCDESLFLYADTFGLYTEVTVNGALSKRAWKPYIFPVPDSAKGKTVKVSFEIYTSVRPMFGDFNGLNKVYPLLSWVKERFNGNPYPCVGVKAISILKGKLR